MDAFLGKFIKDECANYDRHYGGCITGKDCVVEEGNRCGYLEKSVLGPKDYKYRLPHVNYQRIFALYAEATGTRTKTIRTRQCECGANLPPRKKFCDKCREKRRRKTSREYQRKRYRQILSV